MVFSSLIFVCIFLPILLLVYYLTPARHRNWVGLIGSLFFYGWGAPRFLFVLPASALADYIISRMLIPGAPRRRRVCAMTIGVGLNVGLLLCFKYANFFVDQVNAVLLSLSMDAVHWTRLVLPIGISFFTFQKLSYLIDVYRGVTSPARSFRDYLLYVALFPQLIAGPIVRYHDIAAQLVERRFTCEIFLRGVWRFCLGLSKKVLLANPMGFVADLAFGVEGGSLPTAAAWIGSLCYAFQIYFDFSGYSDMAIGLGDMLGFRFLENFKAPYIARSITEFWRRWHISLSNWMREYLYIPLGGNRVSAARRIVNLWIVFLLCGLWHGAAWSFLFWGAYHGAFLTIDKLLGERRKRLPAWLSVPGTFIVVVIGWVFFRADTVASGGRHLGCMLGLGAAAQSSLELLGTWMTPQRWIALGVCAIYSFAPILRPFMETCDWEINEQHPHAVTLTLVRTLLCTLMLLVCIAALITGGFNPFIYFRF